MSPSTPKIAALLFGSGMAALVYQTAWERMLRLVFGASTAASSAVLAIFLGGLGLGGAWLGRRAERSDRPLLLYGNLEVGVALTAAVTPLTVGLLSRIYYGLGGQGALGPHGATAVRLLLALFVLGPSVVLMGGTLPAAARAAETEADVGRSRLAILYATNTAGAVVGALLGTFVLFELFGTRLSLWTAALVNLLVALLARREGSRAALVPVRVEVEATSERANEPSDEAHAPPTSRATTVIVYAAAALVGLCFLGLEVVWYRALGPILGGSSFTFGLILAVALSGIGVGSFVYSRRRETRAATLSLLALTVGLEALCVGFPLALGDGVALLAAYLRTMSGLGFGALVATWVAVAFLVVFPAACVAGFQFPVLFALIGRGRHQVARQVGLTYAFNTVGSIVGALLVGFVLFPRIGVIGTWRLIVLLLVFLAVGLLVLEIRSAKRAAYRLPTIAAVGFIALALACASAKGPTAVSRHTPIGAGRIPIANLDRNGVRDWMHQSRRQLRSEYDGVESTVGVVQHNGLSFLVNGKSDGAVIGDRGTQTFLGILPAILHPNPKTGFVLGLGTGMTAGWLASVPSVERVDVAELEPAVVEVAKSCSLANQDALARENVRVFLGDGREFLLTNDRQYDLIISEPSNPYRAGVSSLFTQEFYRLVARRLAPGGVLAQWVQAYDIDANTFRIVLATLHSVFPHVEAWQPQSGDLILLAGAEPRIYDMELLRRRVVEEPYKTALPRTGLIQDAEGVLARHIASEEVVARLATVFDVPVNTDDVPILEYAFARNVGVGAAGISNHLVQLTVPRGLARPKVSGNVDWGYVDELRSRAWLVTGDSPPAPASKDPGANSRAQAVEAGCYGDVKRALFTWRTQERNEPRDVVESYVLGAALAQAKDDGALELAERLQRQGFLAEYHVIRARLFAGKGQRKESTDELLAAIAELRTTALPLCDTARQALDLLSIVTAGHPDLQRRAVRELLVGELAVAAQEELRARTAQNLAFQLGDPQLCVEALGRALEDPPWSEAFLRLRAECLVAAKHALAQRARDDLADWIAASPGSIGAGLDLPPVPTAGQPVPDVEVPLIVDAGLVPLEPVPIDAGAPR